MKFSIRFADKIVGVLVILALAILVVVIFMIGRSQRWFARDYQFLTYYSSASGLTTGMPVQYMGFTIGHVKKIDLVRDEENANIDRVEITFTIFDKYIDRARYGSMVEVQVSPIGLGNSFIFYSGKGNDPIPEGSVIPEFNSPEAKRFVAGGLVDRTGTTGDSINNIILSVNDFLGEAAGLFSDVGDLITSLNDAITGQQTDGVSAIGQIMQNIETVTRNLSVQLSPIMDNLETVTERISDPSGSVMNLLDPEGSVFSELVNSLESVTGILDNLDKTSEFIPSNLPGLLIDLNAALRSAQDVMTALTNNPLLRRGVPVQTEASPGGAGSRNMEF